ncbi:MAG TPA: DUF1326 domain-containing protein [Solirubrobacteraceae bacterium]|nr:DUF1326 domain-containing protein [Solirubrobacteraceae bacterium]
MAEWRLEGPYMKNCNCDPGCPCDFNADPTHHECEGMAAMLVEKGHFGDVSLDGAKWAFIYHWPGPLHEGQGTAQPVLDAGMSDEQREALGAILSGQNGGTFYGILSEIIDTFHDPVVADVDIEIDVEGRRARCAVDGVLETESAPIAVVGEETTDYSIQVRIPNGFEYDECEVAQAKVLRGTGEIKFEHEGSHSSLARVARTPDN